MARWRKLTNPLALAVLGMLASGPMHPYQIAHVLKHRGKDETFKIRYGSLYTVVQDLEKRGLVEAEGTVRAGHRPERTVYRLTAEGRAELDDRLRELLSEPVKEYPVFAAVLSLMAELRPDEVAALLRDRLAKLQVDIAATRAAIEEAVVGQHLPRIFLVETEYGLAMKQAEADWVRELIRDLTEGARPDIKQWRAWHETGEFPQELLDTDWAQADLAILTRQEVEEPD